MYKFDGGGGRLFSIVSAPTVPVVTSAPNSFRQFVTHVFVVRIRLYFTVFKRRSLRPRLRVFHFFSYRRLVFRSVYELYIYTITRQNKRR